MTVNAPAETTVDFRSLLIAELEHAGLIPDAERVLTCRREVSRIGYEEEAALADLVGKTLWAEALAQLGRPYPHADCERVLGFGAMLTAFMLPPVRIDDALSREVCSLGAHANLLVSLFDQVADECPGAALPLSRATVQNACAKRGRVRLIWHRHAGPPVARLLTRFLSAYVSRLDRLPYTSHHRALRALHTRAIIAMHAAELETLSSARSASFRSIRRKSALPFVVMGMPAWLGVERGTAATFHAHLRWLYRLGNFFGFIDDAADLGADRAAGRPNRVAQLLAREPDECACDGYTALARGIASQGRRIMEQRRAWASRAASVADDVLTTTLLSWLDAIPR
ncbi:MAG: hypothetical protein ACJ796_05175 [Gemmatimonadaceae bacterium]